MSTIHYTMYRSTTIGSTLEQTLEDFVNDGSITDPAAKRVLLNFDKAVNTILATHIKNRFTFKAKKLRAYRFCDNVWTFVMEEAEVKDPTKNQHAINRMKIVACDASRK
uniref:Transcription initiation factor IIA subunit 2 n=1 Tax=Panagrolaimus superbus TaxID=310955 RepID=A0A914Z070_9BILA